MIKVKISYKGEFIESISIKGHANFDNFGKDIVCASVSSIVITSINAIIRLDNKAIEYEENEGIFIKVLKQDKITHTLLLNMVSLLSELEKQYKKNIIINKEVHSWDC